MSQLIVDVDGKVVELKGSAEAQFQQWRALLRDIATTEAALPVDINVTRAPPPPSETEPPAPCHSGRNACPLKPPTPWW